MAKKDFPWFSRQRVRLACRLAFHAGRHFITAGPFRTWQRCLLRRYDESLHGEFPAGANTAIVFLSCDEQYFARFGIHLVRSCFKHAPDLNVHLHVNCLSAGYREELNRLLESEGKGRLSFTWDDIRFDHLDGAQRWYYLASVRFVRLHQLVSRCDVPVLSVDADGVIVKSPLPKLDELAGEDVAIYLRPGNTLDWRKVLASALVVMPTTNGRAFIRDVGLMIARLLRGPVPYHIDQLVIYYMWDQYCRSAAGFHCAALSQEMADWECSEHSYIWSAKGDRKYQDAVFRKAQSS